ncbi:hypothetical protein WDU94_005331 [Cyamophila willieti]
MGQRLGQSQKPRKESWKVAEMRMLRWMCGLTRRDRVRNERIRETVKVGSLGKKVQESRLRWFGHVERRDESYLEGVGRPKKTWKNCVIEDMRAKGVRRVEAQDRDTWRRLTKNFDPA